MLSLRHLQTPLLHLFSALGAVTGWAGLSHPGLNRTFRSPEGTGVSVAAGASLGLGGKAAVSQCRMESCGRHKCCTERKELCCAVPKHDIYPVCIQCVIPHLSHCGIPAPDTASSLPGETLASLPFAVCSFPPWICPTVWHLCTQGVQLIV